MSPRTRHRAVAIGATAVVLAAGAAAALNPPRTAGAAPRTVPAVNNCPTYAATFGPNAVAVTFHYQAFPQTWIVPSTAVSGSICIDASGAQGGASSAAPGGTGGDVNVVTNASANQALRIVIGKRGASSPAGGGAGGGGTYVFAPDGSVLAVAGGGGGAGTSANGGGGGQTREAPTATD